MPAKKQSQEEKEALFAKFQETEEYKQYSRIVEAKESDQEVKTVENSTSDINSDWTKILHELYQFVLIAKVPHKSKSYAQAVIRTMFFERLQENLQELTFDGVKYPVSAAANLDHWNCRNFLVLSIWEKFSSDAINELNANNYKAFKTDCVKMMKDWDKRYVKHMK